MTVYSWSIDDAGTGGSAMVESLTRFDRVFQFARVGFNLVHCAQGRRETDDVGMEGGVDRCTRRRT